MIGNACSTIPYNERVHIMGRKENRTWSALRYAIFHSAIHGVSVKCVEHPCLLIDGVRIYVISILIGMKKDCVC